MQQTNRKKPGSGVLNGIKILLASGAVAGAVGIWSILAGNAMSDSSVTGQDAGNNGLADLPTLVPLADIPTVSAVAGIDPLTGLRNVAAPTQGAVIQAPAVQSVIIGGSTASGGTTVRKPAARTRSSRRR